MPYHYFAYCFRMAASAKPVSVPLHPAKQLIVLRREQVEEAITNFVVDDCPSASLAGSNYSVSEILLWISKVNSSFKYEFVSPQIMNETEKMIFDQMNGTPS